MHLKIGEFAKRTGTTVKMLRHYDEIGLLHPEETDGFTGYRLYTEHQQKLVAWIQLLKNLGFSLKEIRQALQAPVETEALVRLLKEKRTGIAAEQESWIIRRVQIDKLILLIERNGFAMNDTIDLSAIALEDVHDIKKNMPNREMFQDRALEVLAAAGGGPAVVLRMDIRHFKRVNDDYGFDAGDRMIVVYYELLVEAVKAHTASYAVARAGGDEFTAFFMGGPQDARRVMEGLIAKIEGYNFAPLGAPVPMGASLGAVCATLPPQDLNALRRAEEASHQAIHDAWQSSNARQSRSAMHVLSL